MNTQDLTGPDLVYWQARANLHGRSQEKNVLRRHYGQANLNDPSDEAHMKAFVLGKIGPVLPERSEWH